MKEIVRHVGSPWCCWDNSNAPPFEAVLNPSVIEDFSHGLSGVAHTFKARNGRLDLQGLDYRFFFHFNAASRRDDDLPRGVTGNRHVRGWLWQSDIHNQ